MRYFIRSIPAFLPFRGGPPVGSVRGDRPTMRPAVSFSFGTRQKREQAAASIASRDGRPVLTTRKNLLNHVKTSELKIYTLKS